MTIKLTSAKLRRQTRVRGKISGTKTNPRLTVHRSNKHLIAQLVDDTQGRTLAGLSTSKLKGTKTERATILGEHIAQKAKDLKITQAVFDRGSFRYHGRLKALADAARAKGLKI